MADIVITPDPMELGLNRAACQGVVQDLDEAGHNARLVPPIEERNATGYAVHAAYVLTIYVLARIRDETIDEIIATVLHRLRFRKGPRSSAPGPELSTALERKSYVNSSFQKARTRHESCCDRWSQLHACGCPRPRVVRSSGEGRTWDSLVAEPAQRKRMAWLGFPLIALGTTLQIVAVARD
jgi:hypothetical protein